MARRDTGPDFIEALARGLDVIRAFQPHQPVMSLAAVVGAAGLARPTARRILLTLDQLGYVRHAGGGFELTPRVLELGMNYVLSRNLWEVARPHLEGWSGAPTSPRPSRSSTARTSSTWPGSRFPRSSRSR